MAGTDGSEPPVIVELADISRMITQKNFREYFHDALERREEMFNLFEGMMYVRNKY